MDAELGWADGNAGVSEELELRGLEEGAEIVGEASEGFDVRQVRQGDDAAAVVGI